jgi:hypothetical protein
MTVDYDAPRHAPVDAGEPLDELSVRRNDPATAVLDVDEADGVYAYELPGADLSDEEFMVRVVPKQPDEFTCSTCFLVHHRSRLARGNNGTSICTDCA